MIRRRLKSLLAMLCLLMAAAVSLAQPVAVAGTHLHLDAEVWAAITDHGHFHESDLPDHNPADHTHDVASDVQPAMVSVMTWATSWTQVGNPGAVPAALGGYDRPPRPSLAT